MNPLLEGCKKNQKFIVITNKNVTKTKKLDNFQNNIINNPAGINDIMPKIEEKTVVDTDLSQIDIWKLQEDVERRINSAAIDSDEENTPLITRDVNILIDLQGNIPGGAVTTKTVGETTANISKSFIDIDDTTEVKITSRNKYNKKDRDFIIAVLDTGVNEGIIPDELLWIQKKDKSKQAELDEYKYDLDFDDIYVDKTTHNKYETLCNNYIVDNKKLLVSHGTLVCLYILNELRAAPDNIKKRVKLMIIKTHNDEGEGNLSTAIEAIRFAANNGAKIINASWGYNSLNKAQEFLDASIARFLEEKKVLLVAAAGNKLKKIGKDILNNFNSEFNTLSKKDKLDKLRDLDKLPFYPACISTDDNNIITVTTTNGIKVSPTQNFSSKFIDVAVTEGKVEDGTMGFRVPFEDTINKFPIRGSSYAAAIATGIIAANWNNDWSEKKPIKPLIFDTLSSVTSISRRLAKEVKIGRYITKN